MRSYDEKTENILHKRDEVLRMKQENKKKAARLGIIAAVLALLVVVSAVAVIASRARREKPVIPTVTDTEAAGTGTNAATEPPETEKTTFNDGVIGENTGSAEYAGEDSYSSSPKGGLIRSDEAAAPSAASPTVDYGYDIPEGMPSENAIDAKAGTITAGEWSDMNNFADWRKLLEKDDWKAVIGSRKIDPSKAVSVKVLDGEAPCFNVPVKLMAGDEVLYSGRTDVNGRVLLFYDVSGNGKAPDKVVAGEAETALEGKNEIEISAAQAGIAVTKLDLMLMIDTTGSMGDELEYIKTELYDVVARVAATDGNISIRCSVNFYRDEGDDYVVKYYDFRSDINECIEQMKKEYAFGGGDYPEAVHTALENAVTGHEWREDAVKLCFFVLDAPPHSEQEIQGVNASLLSSIRKAAELGIRMIPVASSGVDLDTEYLLRSFAVMTGGTYIFITNDSGIGSEHKEAEVGEHTVEYLNECMIRVISEYCGTYTGEKIPYTPTYRQ